MLQLMSQGALARQLLAGSIPGRRTSTLLSNSGSLPAALAGAANPPLRTISVDAATAAAAGGASLGVRPLPAVLEGGSAAPGQLVPTSSLGGSLYRSLTAPSMSGYIAGAQDSMQGNGLVCRA